MLPSTGAPGQRPTPGGSLGHQPRLLPWPGALPGISSPNLSDGGLWGKLQAWAYQTPQGGWVRWVTRSPHWGRPVPARHTQTFTCSHHVVLACRKLGQLCCLDCHRFRSPSGQQCTESWGA